MGNANGREDGGSDTQSVAEDSASAQVAMADQHAPEYIGGHSPPSSPRASHSPLMFRPQMPVVPLQRPDELNIPSPSWMQTSSGYEDVYNEQGIPTMITWSYGGKEVSVEGSWDGWKSRKPLQRSGKDFTIMKVLPSGVYQYRFLVDGQWRHSPDLPWEQDDSGNAYNVLDLQDYVPEDIDSISGFEPPQSPDSSYSNTQLGQEDFGKEPPMVPPHLNLTLLNAPSPQMEIPPPYSRPQHVVLNHLYMHRDRNRPSVVALGSTNRFLSKYVTVVLYKSIQR
ncbi:SNF1-related protein kinase regulatory subunit beta-2-like [Salvia hispanica]|uniref:SNF1-related protein kinase regulatory subunit beta-2-like n=1 Tax=Salvia hispanica TaxID=49212 RepID=UPI0020092D46|nr:SNF1-related protein kinase regulatory subunit beta-2-like [Salvia hispanica]